MNKEDRRIAISFQLIILFIVLVCILVGSHYALGQEIALAEVVRVVDGDTLKVKLNGLEETIRVLGVDTPERGQKGYREATEYTAQFVGVRVVMVGESGLKGLQRDRFCRILAYVHNEQGMDLSAALVASGHAIVYRKYECGRTAFYLLIEKLRGTSDE
ncbi:MAG: thermonuclease family protein [Gammaproteobacteria bacterium]|nr:thermonuclease family protein [Gammaproteobacteria bacterium]